LPPLLYTNTKNGQCHHARKIISDQLDAKKEVVGVFLDLKEAFDSVNRDILTKKLECGGVRGIALK